MNVSKIYLSIAQFTEDALVLLACKIVQVKMVFSPVVLPGQQREVLFYGEAFKFRTGEAYQAVAEDGTEVVKPAPDIDMFIVDRHFRANKTRMGDIYRLSDIREVVELVPRFGARMPDGIDCNNSLDLMNTFYVNNFSDKENFHAILSYQ